MADDGDDDSWGSFFENNRSVPLHKTRREKEEGDSIPYRLNLKSVEGIPIPSFVVSKSSEFPNVNKRIKSITQCKIIYFYEYYGNHMHYDGH